MSDKIAVSFTLPQLARLWTDVENSIERYEKMLAEQRGYSDPDLAMVESLEQMIANRREILPLLRQAGRELVATQAEEDRAQ